MRPLTGGMPLSLGGEFALAVYVFPLVLAALSDFRYLRIPNWLTGSMAAAFPLAALLAGHDVQWLSHLAAALAVFVGAAGLFAFRLMGGGDVKLLAATALWTGLGGVPSFLMLVAVLGGVFAVLMLLLRHPVMQAAALGALHRLPTVMQVKMPIPYGVPIAMAGILMGPTLPFLG